MSEEGEIQITSSPENSGKKRTIILSTESVDVEVPEIVISCNNVVNDQGMKAALNERNGTSGTFKGDYDNFVAGTEMQEIRKKIYWNLLVDTINRTGYTPPQDRQTVILDLGCNEAEEA